GRGSSPWSTPAWRSPYALLPSSTSRLRLCISRCNDEAHGEEQGMSVLYGTDAHFGVAVTCLGCYATRSADDDDRECACDNGYTEDIANSILDYEFAHVWTPSPEVSR